MLKRYGCLIGMITIFVLLVWIPVESAWSHFCFNNYDLGIYAQTVQLIGLDSPNPWLTTRDLHIFNDHFEPIHFFAAMFKPWLHPSLLILRIDMISILIAAFAPIWLAFKRQCSVEIALCSSSTILFSPLILDAAFFPAHPGTWSLAAFAWMFAFLLMGWDVFAIFMLLVIFSCKEEYPVVGFVMGAGLYYIGRRSIALWFMVLSSLWFIGVFYVRPLIIGPADMYTQAVTQGSGFDLFRSWDLAKPVVSRFFEVLIPIFIFKSVVKFRNFTRIEWVFVLCLLTLLGIRLVGGFWGNHRSAPVGVALAFVLIGFARHLELSKSQKILCPLVTLVLAFPSLEVGSRIWRGKSFKKHCSSDFERISAINETNQYLRDHQDGPVLAQGNLVPHLVDLLGIAQIGATKSKEFKYFYAETSAKRNTWPLSENEFQQMEQDWRSHGSKIIRDDEFVLLIER